MPRRHFTYPHRSLLSACPSSKRTSIASTALLMSSLMVSAGRAPYVDERRGRAALRAVRICLGASGRCRSNITHCIGQDIVPRTMIEIVFTMRDDRPRPCPAASIIGSVDFPGAQPGRVGHTQKMESPHASTRAQPKQLTRIILRLLPARFPRAGGHSPRPISDATCRRLAYDDDGAHLPGVELFGEDWIGQYVIYDARSRRRASTLCSAAARRGDVHDQAGHRRPVAEAQVAQRQVERRARRGLCRGGTCGDTSAPRGVCAATRRYAKLQYFT